MWDTEHFTKQTTKPNNSPLFCTTWAVMQGTQLLLKHPIHALSMALSFSAVTLTLPPAKHAVPSW